MVERLCLLGGLRCIQAAICLRTFFVGHAYDKQYLKVYRLNFNSVQGKSTEAVSELYCKI